MARKKRGPGVSEPPAAAGAGERTIPPPLPPEAMGQFVLGLPEIEERRIREYGEWQARDETVKHAEKVKSEPAFGDRQVHLRRRAVWVVDLRCGATRLLRRRSRFGRERRHLPPHREAVSQYRSIARGREPVPARADVAADRREAREEGLRACPADV
jgi:hypothetical protein